ncbi:MAG: PsbP-related protein [Nitrososphaeraceae archaeon]
MTSVFTLSLFFVASSFFGSGYGQEENKTEWLSYTDPEGKFSLEYPADWTIKERENRLDAYNLILFNPFFPKDRSIINVNLEKYSVSNPNAEKNLTGLMKTYQSQDTLTSDFEIIDDNLGKYNVDGNQTINYIASFTKNGHDIEAFRVLAYTDNGIFDIIYFTTPKNFDKYFPIVERLIKSVKISDQV